MTTTALILTGHADNQNRFKPTALHTTRTLVLTALVISTVFFLSFFSATAFSQVERSSLQQLLASEVNRFNQRDAASVFIFDTATGAKIFSHREQEPRIPASVLKLLTSYTAFRTLGSDYRFVTVVRSDRLPNNSTAQGDVGDVYLVGGGDPSLVTERLVLLVAELERRGVRKIGQIYFDTSYAERLPRTGTNPYQAASGPIVFNHNSAEISIAPSRRGERPLIVTNIAAPQRVENHATTVAGSVRNIRISESMPVAHTDQQPGKGSIVRIDGEIGSEAFPVVEYWSVADPIAFFARAWVSELKHRGITVAGIGGVKTAPSESKILSEFSSLPLSEILQGLNRYSNNLIAHQVALAIGRRSAGDASLVAAIGAMSKTLQSLGEDSALASLWDGSGLDARNRISARALAAVLKAAWSDFSIQPHFVSSLTQYAAVGTLRTRTLNVKDQRRVWAKTGSIDGVSALAGFAENSIGRRFGFVILVNGGIAKEQAIRFEDRLVEIVVNSN